MSSKKFFKYFITGGSGFIGSNLCNYLIRNNITRSITVYDNLVNGKFEYIEDYVNSGYINFIEADLQDYDILSKSMKSHDVVFHLAANADIALSASSTKLDLDQTIISTYNVLESMRINDIRRIIYSSGSGVYGNIGYHHATENYSPLMPVSMYGATKLSAEALICAFSSLFNIEAYIYRFANVVGQNQTHGVAYDFINRLLQNNLALNILGNGLQSKSYIHVDDVINAIFFTLDSNNINSINIYNVSTQDSITVKEIAEIVANQMNLNPKLLLQDSPIGWPGDVPIVRLDSSKLRSAGWSNKLNTNEAIKLSVQQMLKAVDFHAT